MKEFKNKRALNNAHKILFLHTQYPEKKVTELAQIFNGSPMDYNVAIWLLEDLKLIEIDQTTHSIATFTKPEKWEFGEEVEYLLESLPFVFKKLAEDEADLEDNYLGNWTSGHAGHDVMVAIRYLMEQKVLASYTVTNTVLIKKATKKKGAVVSDEVYTFYTLPENAEHKWGRKQFPDQKMLKD